MSSIGDRVIAVMRKRGMAQKTLAEHTQMTPDAMSRALRGQRGFAAVELADIARALDEDVYYLITGELDPARLNFAARHRFDHETKTRSVDGLEEDRDVLIKIQTAFNLAGELSATSKLPADPAKFREILGPGFVERFADKLEVLGVDVVVLSELTTAYSFTVTGRKVIAVNGSGNWFNENWSIAHELAHHALGHEDVRPCSDKVDVFEAKANNFAAQLLLPEESMRAFDWQSTLCNDLADFLWESGVSTGTVKARLNKLGIVPSHEISAALELKTQGVLRKYWSKSRHVQGPDKITDRMARASARCFPTWLRSAHLQRIESGKLNKSYLAWMLGTNEAELEVPDPAPMTPIEGDELLSLLR